MIGASKIDRHTDDLDRLNEMFEMGLNNCEIQRTYRTSKGEQLSRIHISAIRNGKRWNTNNHSFVMKDDKDMSIATVINETLYKTVVGVVLTNSSNYHIYLTYKNGKLFEGMQGYLMIEKPSINELMTFHNQWVRNEHRA